MSNIQTNGAGKLRCAIYTRKSSDEGLDQSFNSLDAQREACEAFIASQASLGWKVIPELYDDGGISGGTMDRPALQRLLRDIRDRKIDVVVVYKIDRLTRSLMDFSRIVEVFDQNGVSFVSITQQFNTTTSMGRLTLNVLLSFAQFEREVTAERIRDKVAASKKKGMWMGGNVPLGYQVKDRKLVVDQQEAQTVRWLFRRYLDLKSLTDLSREAQANNLHRSETRRQNGTPFGRGKLHHLLTNPIYIGKIRHKQAIYEGEHEALIDTELFTEVQALLTRQAPKRRSSSNSPERHLLGGLLQDDKGQPFLLAHAQNHGRRYRYYVSRTKQSMERPTSQQVGAASKPQAQWRLPAAMIEPIVEQQLQALLTDKPQLARWAEAYGSEHGPTNKLQGIIDAARALNQHYQELVDPASKQRILRTVFSRIVMQANAITFDISARRLIAMLCKPDLYAQDHDPAAGEDTATASEVVSITIPIQLKRRGVEGHIVLQGSSDTTTRKDPVLIGMIAKAHLYLQALTDGSSAGISDIAERLGIHTPDISRILPMAFLSPKITEAILTGQQPADLTIARLTRMLNLPLGWQEQHEMLSG